MLESGHLERFAQSGNGKFVILVRFGTYKTNRPTYGDVSQGSFKLFFGMFVQIAQNAGDQFFQSMPAAKHLCSSQCAASQARLQRLDQPTLLLLVEVAFDGGCAPD